MSIEKRIPQGIAGFPVAPFNEGGELDVDALKVNIEFLLDEGLESIFIACGSGEYQSLNLQEYEQMIDTAADAVRGRVPLYTGVGGNIQEAIVKAKLSEKKQVDGYLILPPYLIEGEQEGVLQYYTSIITSTNLNAIIYQRNNAILKADTVEKLVDYPQVVGLKDGHGNMELNIELTHRFENRLEFLNGMPMAEVTMPAYHPLGFHGYSSAISNYIPHISRKFYDALKNGDQETVKDIYQEVIFPINNIRKKKKGYAVSLIKAGMEIVGLPVNNTARPPVLPVEPAHYEEFKDILQKALKKYPSKRRLYS
ncbi:5-dehydro-4-deoxyglucarate dehydratase [Halobacillus sp. Marseille-P3879]|uniref:5-dehydro-4-deoxyglucarate dehydratase n=1 Tax=Halobacillus sp. Marseille-P3879 TaxID=2045014 RepID=UPI000C7B9B1B|nr:5-dehydro-4-deoxyglucarate dehydratase [Halobacillus sp. Marseille-P3879]